MKKIIVITIALSLAFSGLAFANEQACAVANKAKSLHASRTTTAATSSSPLIGKMSTGVFAGWNTSTTAYTLVTQHDSGSKMYGSAHDSTSIFSHDTINKTQAVGTAGATYFNASGWTAL